MNDVGREMQQHVPKPIAEDWGHLDPSRWWFAQSAFPLIAGTLGPVATAFSICALVRPWRQLFPPGTDVDQAPSIPDPDWLIAINAVQLAVAVVANMALLLNMTRRLSFSIAQPVTIVGWYVSSMTLVALTATASGPLALEPPTKFIWSQAFYYAIYSAVLYFLVAALLTVTYTAAQSGRYSKDFMLTPSQRTLMLQTIMFLLYLLLGALLFSKLEDWPYLDAVYWAAVTLFTVGFGDFRPETKVGRALLMPYALIGIISLGLVIGSIRSLVLDRAKRRIGARMVEKRRRHTLRRLSALGRDDILVPIGDELPSLSPARTDSSGMTEFERRELEFKLMRKIQRIAARRRRWFAMAISAGTWLALWLAGARVFQVCEEPYQGWTYFDGFYFAFVSFTTIGYGDLTPVSNPGRSFWVFWALLAVPTMTVLISNAGETIIKAIRDATDQIATVTILPSEQGFKKDFKRLLRTLSFGVLFEEEDVAEEPPGFLGLPIRLIPRSSGANNNNNNDDNDAAETMQRDEADLEAEGADTEKIKQRRAECEEYEEGNAAQVEANAAGEVARSKPSPSSHRSRSAITFQTPSRPASRRPSPARRHLPSSVPASRPDYHVTLIEEIGRVTRHLKHHPPRKYTFREWAWYLRLIGEDEADAERHRKANPKAKGTKERRRTGNLGEVGPDGHPLPWSWVGSRSPLMGSQEEAEWILARLIARLGEELRDVREEEQGTFGTDSRGRERSL